MRLRRLFAAAAMEPGRILDLPADSARHAAKVLRMRAGAEAIAFDGRGAQFRIRLIAAGKRGVRVEVLEPVLPQPEPPLPITLAQGLCRREKMDWVIQKATELGVARIVPVITERSVARLDSGRSEKRLTHWRAVIAHACEQCGRSVMPSVDPAVGIGDFLESHEQQYTGIVLDPDATQSLAKIDAAPTGLTLLTGPEGGLTSAELETAVHAGFSRAAIGPRTLRTETAALAGIALVQARWGDL
jgi:16S rRNA (uracil1498-N3)-methyltransferase